MNPLLEDMINAPSRRSGSSRSIRLGRWWRTSCKHKPTGILLSCCSLTSICHGFTFLRCLGLVSAKSLKLGLIDQVLEHDLPPSSGRFWPRWWLLERRWPIQQVAAIISNATATKPRPQFGRLRPLKLKQNKLIPIEVELIPKEEEEGHKTHPLIPARKRIVIYECVSDDGLMMDGHRPTPSTKQTQTHGFQIFQIDSDALVQPTTFKFPTTVKLLHKKKIASTAFQRRRLQPFHSIEIQHIDHHGTATVNTADEFNPSSNREATKAIQWGNTKCRSWKTIKKNQKMGNH